MTQLDKFNADLMAVAVDTAAARARLAFIDSELKEMMERSQEELAIQTEIDNMALQLENAKQDVKRATSDREFHESKLAGIRPATVELIEANDRVLDFSTSDPFEGGGGFQ